MPDDPPTLTVSPKGRLGMADKDAPPPRRLGSWGNLFLDCRWFDTWKWKSPRLPPPPGSDHMTVMGKSITRPRNAAKLANFGKVGHFG